MRFRLLAACISLTAALASGCGAPRQPVVPITAPAANQRIRIHVHNADRARAEREESVNLYTIFLRQAVERQLTRAGYRVVQDPGAPYDLTAEVTLGDFSISSRPNEQATASMTLRAPSGIVDQLSAVVVLDDESNIDDHGPTSLVDALTRSPRVAEFAATLPTQLTPAEAQPKAVVAAPSP